MGSKSYDESYKKVRSHSVGVLKHFGYGDRRVMETKIHAEFEHLAKFLRSKQNSPFDPMDILNLTTLNVMYQLMFGQRFEAGDPTEVYLRSFARSTVAAMNPLYDIFPFVAYLPPFRQQVAHMRSVSTTWNEFIKRKIHDEGLNEGKNSEDNFVKSYRETAGEDYDEEELAFVLREFTVAGTDTTATQLCWALVVFANHVDVQRRVQASVFNVNCN